MHPNVIVKPTASSQCWNYNYKYSGLNVKLLKYFKISKTIC